MNVSAWQNKSTEELIAAFDADGFDVTQQVSFQGKRGLCAQSRTAYNYETKAPKKAFYVEGRGFEMGYLMGLMAPDEVEQMATEFLYNIIPAMLDPKLEHFQRLWEAVIDFISLVAARVRHEYPDDIPQIYAQEMRGLVAGCKAMNPDTQVTFDRLWDLNTGIDLLLANIYTILGLSELGEYLRSRIPDFKVQDFRLPRFCNGFSVFGEATASKQDHYFSRFFMFPPARVFQNTAAMTIYCPDEEFEGRAPIPLISMGAPGFVGSIAAMNLDGVAAGVDMLPAANCNPRRPGLNSLLLVRHSIQYGNTADDVVALMAEAQRGVSWVYPMADGKDDRAAIIEAGMKTDHLDFLSYPPAYLRPLLPDQAFLDAHPSYPPQNQGLMVRWNDYQYPEAYLRFNEGLFEHYGKHYDPAAFGELGYIDKTYMGTNCPNTFYFAPQRETKNDVVLTTNIFIIPEIRLCMMDTLTVLVSKDPMANQMAQNTYDDSQWRYDELNNLILTSYGEIDWERARKIGDFLNPDGPFPRYYTKTPSSSDGKTKVIEASNSLCNLKTRVIESHYGYYADEWVRLTLPNYAA